MKNFIFVFIFFNCISIGALAQIQVDPKTDPYCLIVKLLMYKGKSQFHGTGVMLNDNTIITNAHNVYEKDSIKIISGYSDNDGNEIGSVTVNCDFGKTIFYDKKFEDDELNDQYDFAVIKYEQKEMYSKIMQITGNKKFELTYTPLSTIKKIHIAGYPFFRFFELGKPKKAKIQFYNSTDNFNVQDYDLVNYRLNTRGGSSGSPLWTVQNNKNLIIGIHKSGSGRHNQGIHYNKERIDLINSWIK